MGFCSDRSYECGYKIWSRPNFSSRPIFTRFSDIAANDMQSQGARFALYEVHRAVKTLVQALLGLRAKLGTEPGVHKLLANYQIGFGYKFRDTNGRYAIRLFRVGLEFAEIAVYMPTVCMHQTQSPQAWRANFGMSWRVDLLKFSTVNQFFMKLFLTSDITIVSECQQMFNFKLPSEQLAQRKDNFISRLDYPLCVMSKLIYCK